MSSITWMIRLGFSTLLNLVKIKLDMLEFTQKLGLKPRPSRATFQLIFFHRLCYHASQFKNHSMKARFKYRIYPTLGQKQRLARLFGCVRVVWNDSLACCQEKYKLGKKKPTNSELQKQFITLAKKTSERVWLSEVFCPCHYSNL